MLWGGWRFPQDLLEAFEESLEYEILRKFKTFLSVKRESYTEGKGSWKVSSIL